MVGRERQSRLLNDRIVLNIGKVANADEIDVTTDGHAVPDAGIVPDLQGKKIMEIKTSTKSKKNHWRNLRSTS